ncbi:uncharacterized protein LOC128157794 [Crassostrea angulata]|uniref:uncharacterized protein LOC128157794 n=1 Tax=Magallana angulata TaxID=2784310 RepID=UPI0022B1070B|nr:uncharacterized protein LOC128157794 [Crassostrea angulata]
MAALLNQQDQLISWIGRPCDFQLLYKISRDGCTATKFHQKCDGQGATVTVLYNTNNTIYGGYLSQSWNSDGGYINDPNAFLFRLQYNGSSNPFKFPVSDTKHAGYGNGSYGPTFGCGHDLSTFYGNIAPQGNIVLLNGYVDQIGRCFTLYEHDCHSITNNNLQVTELEIYKVIGKYPTLCSNANYCN